MERRYTQVLVRTHSAGVFYGNLDLDDTDRSGRIFDARRIWYWDGAATLSQLANDGTSKPENCKFPAPVPWIDVSGIIEILPVTDQAAASIDSVKPWKA